MARGSAHAVHDSAPGEPLQQRIHVVEVRRRLLADDGLAASVCVDAHERLEHAALGAIRAQQPGLDILAGDLAAEPAPVRAQLAQPGTTLQLSRVDELDQARHGGVVTQIADPAEVVARPLPRHQVAEEVVLGDDADAAVPIKDAAHQRGATAADAHDEDGLRLALEPSRSFHWAPSLAVAD